MIGTVIGNYRIERDLSEGGMSHVYIGRTIALTEYLPENFIVVLKVMSDELANEATAKKRFVKEAQILSKLRHRYITRFYEFIPRDAGAVLVMEFVEGTPVDRLIAERGALPLKESICIAQCLLEALVYAHGKGIIHRDIKPANLIQQTVESVKVTDFGIAKIKESGSGSGQTVLTKSGFLLGTPHYMSPEQIRDPKEAGVKSDVYSSGVVLYEMLTGALPFNSKSLPKLIDAVYRGEKQLPSKLRPEIDKELEAIVLRAMHPKMEERYATAREFFEALEEYNVRPTPMPMYKPQPVTVPLTPPAPAPVKPAPAPAPPAPSAKLKPMAWQLVSTAQDQNEKHDVAGENVFVGRDRACTIVLAHPAVSRRHARISISGGELVLEDLKSANGTFVNNARIEKTSVKPGDVVRFGADPACSFVIRCEPRG